jgi:hypothetical protein
MVEKEETMIILHRATCPKCGYPSLANKRGRMMCHEVNENKVRKDIKFRIRRRRRGTSKTEFSGAGNEGGDGLALNFSAGQGELFGKEAT